MKRTVLAAGLLGAGIWFLVANWAGPSTEPQVSYYASGTRKSSAEFAEGLLHGTSREWYRDGTPRSEGRYEEGLREGAWSFWFEDGSLDRTRSGRYVDGQFQLES